MVRTSPATPGGAHTDTAVLAEVCLRAGVELIEARADRMDRAAPYAPPPALREAFLPRVERSAAERRRAAFAVASGDVVLFVDDSSDAAARVTRVLGPVDTEIGERSPLPILSVVVPVHNGAATLAECLEAVLRSDLPRARWELVIVDDASTDGSASIAAGFADTVVRLPGSAFGPAYARNRGVDFARGRYVLFLDADVRVHSDTLRRFVDGFEIHWRYVAIVGSYDANPPAAGIVSQYRNLLHHFFHQRHAGEVQAFWAGCGAIRRDAFERAGMYDEWVFPRPPLEDIELGARIHASGGRILLRSDIQAAHLKRWTLGRMIVTDLQDVGVPWMRVVSQRMLAGAAAPLTQRVAERLNTLLAWLALVLGLVGIATRETMPAAAALAAFGALLVGSRRQTVFFARVRGIPFAVVASVLDWLYFLVNGIALFAGWLLRELVGEPRRDPVVEAFAEVGVAAWPPVPVRSSVSAS